MDLTEGKNGGSTVEEHEDERREVDKMGSWLEVPSPWILPSMGWCGLNYPQAGDSQSISTI